MISSTARLPDPLRKLIGTVEEIERGEVVRTSDVVVPSLTSAEEDPAVVAGSRLAYLHIEAIGVQHGFARDGYATVVGAEVVGTRLEAEGHCKTPEL
jgi:hypothetical protein